MWAIHIRGDHLITFPVIPLTIRMFNILITCLGNICRSPAAEHLLLHRLEDHSLHGRVSISSAGLLDSGKNAAGPVRDILGTEMKITSIYRHSSRTATPSLIDEQDLILSMGIYEMKGILDIRRHPETHLYMDWIYDTRGQEVADPYGKHITDYRRMISLLDGAVDDLLRKAADALPGRDRIHLE